MGCTLLRFTLTLVASTSTTKQHACSYITFPSSAPSSAPEAFGADGGASRRMKWWPFGRSTSSASNPSGFNADRPSGVRWGKPRVSLTPRSGKSARTSSRRTSSNRGIANDCLNLVTSELCVFVQLSHCSTRPHVM